MQFFTIYKIFVKHALLFILGAHFYCLCWRWSPTCQIFMDPRYPTIHAKTFTHAIFWTHVKILWTQATHATLAKIWLMPPTPPPLFSRLFWSLSRLHSNSFFPLLLIIALLIRSWSFVPQNLPLQSFCSLGKRLCLSRWSQSFSEMIPVKIF